MCKASKHLERLKNFEADFNKDFKILREELSKHDKELSEMYHMIEKSKFNASQGYMALRDMQNLLKKRRLVKNELSAMYSLQNAVKKINLQIEIADKNIEKLIEKNDNYTEGWDLSSFEQEDRMVQ